MSDVPHILLVDDDPLFAEAFASLLRQQDWHTTTVETGRAALEQMHEHTSIDLVLLDVHLPDIDGFEVIERAHRGGLVMPVMMISTDPKDTAKLRALELGAESYLTKPLDPGTVISRIRSMVGLHEPDEPVEERVQIGAVTVDMTGEVIHRPDTDAVVLPASHRDALRILIEQRGKPVSRKRLIKEGLGIDAEAMTFTLPQRALSLMLDELIDDLRELIDCEGEELPCIEHVYGQGYRLRG